MRFEMWTVILSSSTPASTYTLSRSLPPHSLSIYILYLMIAVALPLHKSILQDWKHHFLGMKEVEKFFSFANTSQLVSVSINEWFPG